MRSPLSVRLALVVVVVALLFPGAVLATDASPVVSPPPETPALNLAGGGVMAGPGSAWFVPTVAGGQARLEIAARDADRTVGFRVEPAPLGWHLDSGIVDGLSALFDLRWDPGSADAAVAVVAVDAAGQTSAPAYLWLISVAVPPLLGDATFDAAAIRVDESAVLAWRESDGEGQGIARRSVSGEHAAPTPTGCPGGSWTPDLEPIPLEALSLMPDDPAAAPAAPDAAPGPADAARQIPGPALTARLALPDLPAGCHRFRIELVDSLGQTSDAASPALLVGPLPVAPSRRWTGSLDLFRRSAFVTQATPTFCIPAAALMMTNLALGRAVRSGATQRVFDTWAQRFDGLAGTFGTNAYGWTAILDRWSGADYETLYLNSFEAALRTAVARVARTRKPVGIIVNSGTHAWVLHGFVSPADPSRQQTTVRAVFVSGPLYRRGSRGYDPAPDTRLSVSLLRRFWRPLGTGYGNAGKWVLIVPRD